MKKYNQLTEVQRYQIEALKKAKKEQKEIAVIVGVSASTISREIRRNSGARIYTQASSCHNYDQEKRII